MSLHLRYQTSNGGPFTTVDLVAAGVAQIKINVSYSHATTMTWIMYAPNNTYPIPTAAFIQFWDDTGVNPYTGGIQSSAAPLFEGFLEIPSPGDETNTVHYTAMDPTRNVTQSMTLANLGYFVPGIGQKPLPYPGSVPRLVYNVGVDNDDDYAVSLLQWASMNQIFGELFDTHKVILAWYNAAPTVGPAYVHADIAALDFRPQEKQVFESESLRPVLERMLHQWYPSWRLLWYPGSRQWRFGDLTQCPQTTFTINKFDGTYSVLSMHLDRSLDQRSTAVVYVGPPKLVEVDANWSDGGLTLIPSGGSLQNHIATCCDVDLLNRWQITDPFLRIVARILQVPIEVQTGDFNLETVFVPTLLAHYPNFTRAGQAGWRVVPYWSFDVRTGTVTVLSDIGAARYNANPNGGEPNFENPDDMRFLYATFGDPITVRYPASGYAGSAYDVANIQREWVKYDEMLAVDTIANQPITTPMRIAEFYTLAARQHAQRCDIVYTGSAVLDGMQYDFAALNRRINFTAINGDGAPITTGWEGIKAFLTDVEFNFADGLTTLQFSSNQMELMQIDPEHQKQLLRIVALERYDWTYVSFNTTIRERTIGDPAGGFSSFTPIHETHYEIDTGHYYYDPQTGRLG